MSTKPTVFVVDDDPDARESVCALVETMDVDTEAYGSAEAFLEGYDQHGPGCIVSDVRMTGMTGLELLEDVSQREFQLPVILVTAYANVPLTVRALQTGAVTLLEKPCGNQELWDAISDALVRDASERRDAERVQSIHARTATLTDDERQVMQMMIDGSPNKVIARCLDVSLRTVENRRRAVYQKMEAQTLSQLIQLRYVVEKR